MDERHQHYSMQQQQQQHVHHQQHQPNPQVYAAHSQILPSSHHHPQPIPLTIHSAIQPPEYHHGSSHSPQQWGESTQRGQPQPRGQYDAEHLFSAVQQQLESMRDSNRDQDSSRPAGENVERHRTETPSAPSDPITTPPADQQENTTKLTELTTRSEKPAETIPDESTASSSPPSSNMPPLYNNPRQNQEAADSSNQESTNSQGGEANGSQSKSQKEATASQADSDKDKEKGLYYI